MWVPPLAVRIKLAGWQQESYKEVHWKVVQAAFRVTLDGVLNYFFLIKSRWRRVAEGDGEPVAEEGEVVFRTVSNKPVKLASSSTATMCNPSGPIDGMTTPYQKTKKESP